MKEQQKKQAETVFWLCELTHIFKQSLAAGDSFSYKQEVVLIRPDFNWNDSSNPFIKIDLSLLIHSYKDPALLPNTKHHFSSACSYLRLFTKRFVNHAQVPSPSMYISSCLTTTYGSEATVSLPVPSSEQPQLLGQFQDLLGS